MNDEKKPFKDKLKESLQKLGKIKNIEVIICIALIAVMLLLYGVYKENKSQKTAESNGAAVAIEKSAADELAEVLGGIKGAGAVKVYISYDGTAETVYAYDSTVNTVERTDDAGGANLTTKTVEESSVPVFVTVNGEKTPLVSKTLAPKVLGVIIVAEGAGDINVRLQLLRAASTALDINENIIEIFIMN